MSAFTDKTKVFLLDLGERAAKSFIQGAGAVLVTEYTGIIDAVGAGDWSTAKTLSAAVVGGGLIAVGSLLTSLVSKWRTGTASTSKTVAKTAVEQPGEIPPVAVEPAADDQPHDPEHAAP